MKLQQIWPPESVREIGRDDLEALYRFPDVAKWLVVNFVSSTDGAITVAGRSRPLSTEPDRVVFKLGSDLADVVLLGAGTAVVEEFDGVHPDEETADRRSAPRPRAGPADRRRHHRPQPAARRARDHRRRCADHRHHQRADAGGPA